MSKLKAIDILNEVQDRIEELSTFTLMVPDKENGKGYAHTITGYDAEEIRIIFQELRVNEALRKGKQGE